MTMDKIKRYAKGKQISAKSTNSAFDAIERHDGHMVAPPLGMSSGNVLPQLEAWAIVHTESQTVGGYPQKSDFVAQFPARIISDPRYDESDELRGLSSFDRHDYIIVLNLRGAYVRQFTTTIAWLSGDQWYIDHDGSISVESIHAFWCMDEEEGPAIDAVGVLNLAGTASPGSTDSGWNGKARTLDGSTQHFSIAHDSLMSIQSSGGAISGHFYQTSTPGTRETLATKEGLHTEWELSTELHAEMDSRNKVVFDVYLDDASADKVTVEVNNGDTLVAPNVWNYVLAYVSDDRAYLNVNGAVKSAQLSSARATSSSSNSFKLGGPTDRFTGNVDEWSLWERPPTLAELLLLVASPACADVTSRVPHFTQFSKLSNQTVIAPSSGNTRERIKFDTFTEGEGGVKVNGVVDLVTASGSEQGVMKPESGKYLVSAAGTLSVTRVRTGTINNATNANPIVITTSSVHPFVTGDHIYLYNIAGNIAANGDHFVNKLTNNTFELVDQAGSGAYAGTGSADTAVVIPLRVGLGQIELRRRQNGGPWLKYPMANRVVFDFAKIHHNGTVTHPFSMPAFPVIVGDDDEFELSILILANEDVTINSTGAFDPPANFRCLWQRPNLQQ